MAGRRPARRPIVPADPPHNTSTAVASPADLSESFRTAAENVLPAVVQIVSREGSPDDTWARHGHAPVPFGVDKRGVAGESSSSLLGCGVIVDAAGTVLTNHHVVESAGAMSVQTADGRRLKVRNVASDSHADLAVLELEIESTEPLPAAPLGDSRAMRIGDWVLTIGSPLDLGPSVSAGIISATDRVPEGASQVPLLQTDAAINPGSSGGALVNLAGELVGITTAIASRDGGFQGIGFAIPAETARWVTSQLREHGTVRWPDAGVTEKRPAETDADPWIETPEPSPETVVYSVELQLAVADLGAAPAADHEPRPNRGVRIVRIDADGPAFHAGLREAMSILRVGDRVIENLDDFAEALENASIEDDIVLGVQDPDGTREIRVAAAH